MHYNGYTFADVLIEPKKSEIKTRNSVDLSTTIGNHRLRLPVVSANMKNVTGEKMAIEISKMGGLGILHRFCTIEENVQLFNKVQDKIQNYELQNLCGVSIGVKEEDKYRFEKLYESGARIFCIDVAHGHHINVEQQLKFINDMFINSSKERTNVTVIAGNIATKEAYLHMIEWGADAAKVGIGPSPVCRTRYNTGVGVPQLYALNNIYEASEHVTNPISIVADGGIGHVGDFAKAMKFADAVMLGSMISGTSETPGEVFRNENGEFYKVYGGSASGENKGENKFVEGIIKTVKFKGHVKYIIKEIEEGLKSSYSYVGASNNQQFKQKCKFIYLTGGSRQESKI